MDPNEMYGAVLDALTDHAKKHEENSPRKAVGMMAIQPFDAETTDNEAVRAVGVIAYGDMDDIDFVVLKTLPSGEIIPSTECVLWAVEGKEAAA